MGATKHFMYTDSCNEIANIAKVFAHPARVTILKYISEQEGCICNDLVEDIGLSQATISQHLSVIGDAGLLQGRFVGKRKCYCLNSDRFKEFQILMNAFFIKTTSNCC
ncbi:ArsR/SmtB family transcription factor [Psychroserpens algicola]|uniref:Metalloregulator ArsR/SmtB family transcription factor n=1 Tax=Psychroserpens algicola TaxID=1719034 RepID=A0ABT0H8Q0_9FLAO|nr:metalloregulator ArsR/SmtB family transcription factor [Psychroserpens algicola]MCK8480220.1 metalloregulator ArsR/SmtB family transcription factor [Psychroserpens algicola]